MPQLSLPGINALVKKMPFNSLLGIRVVRLHPDGVSIECPLRADLMNANGTLHGGVLATLADSAVGIAINRHFGGLRPIATVEMKINYLKPVAGAKIRARARLLRVGKHLCVGQADIGNSRSSLAATALITYILL
ncbi:MAG TPA: PaaI family thioesterase [Bryobacteraceae bacterium]|nr:PaaI family thioesterase [Bryobacteraceae bacterium]